MSQTAGDWLDQTVEPAIEPELPICDPHHHLWDYPTSRYLVEELRADFGGGHRVEKTVFVECRQFYRVAGPIELRPVGETVFIDSMAGPLTTPCGTIELAAGIVGFADLSLGSRVRTVLEAHLDASSRFRGIRHATAWDPSDRIHNAHTDPPQGLMGERSFREGIGCLEQLGLRFDAWLYHHQLPELTDLARAFPGLPIVLNHMAGPLGIGPYAADPAAVFKHWESGLSALARCPNVSVKLGGRTMSMSGFGWHKRPCPPGSVELAEALAPYFDTCIGLFGAERCMFESNFPVDRAGTSYTVLWNAFKRAARGYSGAERAALFRGTAQRFYGI
jgi:predicted TIM-barrel fold metal-dependent hydrolase